MSVISRSDAELPEEVPFEDILAVERFDRGPAGQRIHMEEFAQVLRYDPKHKYGKGLQKDYSDMLRIIDQLLARPAQDVQEFVNRFVTFILMGNTDAHLKNWAFRYSDGVHPELAPLYDPVCVTAFFEGVPEHDYALNRAIDKTVRDLDALLEKAKVMRRGRILQVAKTVAARARRNGRSCSRGRLKACRVRLPNAWPAGSHWPRFLSLLGQCGALSLRKPLKHWLKHAHDALHEYFRIPQQPGYTIPKPAG